MPLDHTVNGKSAVQRAAVVQSLQQRHHLVESRGELVVGEMPTRHVGRDERAHLGKVAQHGWTDAQLGRPAGRLGLVRPVDAQQFGALAGKPDHELAAACMHDEVAVGDAPVEGPNIEFEALPLRDAGDQLLHGAARHALWCSTLGVVQWATAAGATLR